MSMSVDLLPDAEEAPVRRPRTWPRRVAWVLVMASAGALLGLAFGARIQPLYTAEVDLLVTPMIGNAFVTTGGNQLVDLETESHLPSSDAVLRRVAADGENAPSPQVMRRRLRVHVVTNAQVIVLNYAAESPAQARAMVLRIAKATVAERTALAQAAAASRQEVAMKKLEELKLEQDKMADLAAAGVPIPTARRTLMSQREVALNVELRQASVAALASPGTIIDTVMRGDGHLAKVRLAIVGAFVLLGALLGLWVGRAPRRDPTPQPPG